MLLRSRSPFTCNDESDETGIIVVGRDRQSRQHFYVLEDCSGKYSPDGWASRAAYAYHTWRADRVVGEANNGGDMVESTMRHADPNISFTAVHASRGKIIRAEPIAALYEQHRVHHVGSFAALEDQLCDFNPSTGTYSPDRLDALVWALTALSEDGLEGGWLLESAHRHAEARKRHQVRIGHDKPEDIERKLAWAQKLQAGKHTCALEPLVKSAALAILRKHSNRQCRRAADMCSV